MDSLVSVGIDIGTTSLHLTISRLKLSNMSSFRQAPRLGITQREIIYQSPIYFTPLSDDGSISPDHVAKIVRAEYVKAGIDAREILTGAVIVTGETARLRRAEEVAHAVADVAGDFVVASAGPNLESVLAARGSGAQKASKDLGRVICNIDIGGGTANAAVYDRGNLIDTACLALGGRFLKVNEERVVERCTEAGRGLLIASGETIEVGSRCTHDQLEHFARIVAAAIFSFATETELSDKVKNCLVTEPLRHDYEIDQYWFSGGVAELLFADKLPVKTDNWLPFADMGAYLAAQLLRLLEAKNLPFIIPPEPIRATVIGAGLHTLQVTGSTIAVPEDGLPLRNIPFIRPFDAGDSQFVHEFSEQFDHRVLQALQECLQHHDLDWRNKALAVVLPRLPRSSHKALTAWSQALAQAFMHLHGSQPLIIVMEQDLAMALGMLLRKHLQEMRIIVVDGVKVEEGDYIDIGKPLSETDSTTIALPVVIKSLVFNK